MVDHGSTFLLFSSIWVVFCGCFMIFQLFMFSRSLDVGVLYGWSILIFGKCFN